MKILGLIILYFAIAINSIADDSIYITKGKRQAMPIAINNFQVYTQKDKSLADDIKYVIINDLNSSGLFRCIPNNAFIEGSIGVEHKPFFASWRQINASAILNASLRHIAADKFEVKVIFWDTITEKSLFAQSFTVPSALWRKMAHQIADMIYENITGDVGYFDTKIFYVAEYGDRGNRMKRLAVMDQDGANHKFLSDGRNIVLTPRLSHKISSMLYVAYKNRQNPQIYLKDFTTNRDRVIGPNNTMSFAPRFSPDGRNIVMSMTRDGITNIFELNIGLNKIRQLTYGIAIDTSPCYSADGSQIYFNSDRSGSKQLYVMNADGSGAKRISFNAGGYTSPVVSPDGRYIACIKSVNDEFQLCIINTQDFSERSITSGWFIESPSWAPNSKLVSFRRVTKPSRGEKGYMHGKISIIDISGMNERTINTPHGASDPEWSYIVNKK